MDWTPGETVEVKLYHLTGEPAPALPRVERPGRAAEVTLVSAGARGPRVTWEAPANGGRTGVLDYLVFLKREADGWSAASGQVFTPSGAPGELLEVTYAGLEAGEPYRAMVYARSAVGVSTGEKSVPVKAPEVPSITLSSLSVTGTSSLDFVPFLNSYPVQVDAGVTETTISVDTAEKDAETEGTVVRSAGKLAPDTADANPKAEGDQARLSSTGDTRVRVSSADRTRVQIYDVTLARDAAARSASGGPWLNLSPWI